MSSRKDRATPFVSFMAGLAVLTSYRLFHQELKGWSPIAIALVGFASILALTAVARLAFSFLKFLFTARREQGETEDDDETIIDAEFVEVMGISDTEGQSSEPAKKNKGANIAPIGMTIAALLLIAVFVYGVASEISGYKVATGHYSNALPAKSAPAKTITPHDSSIRVAKAPPQAARRSKAAHPSIAHRKDLSPTALARDRYLSKANHNPRIASIFDEKYDSFYASGSYSINSIIEAAMYNQKERAAEYQYAAGILYLRGVGVGMSPVEGCAWLTVAATNGHDSAVNPLSVVYNALNQKGKKMVKTRANEIVKLRKKLSLARTQR